MQRSAGPCVWRCWWAQLVRAQAGPDQVVRQVSDQLVTLAKDKRGLLETDPSAFYAEVGGAGAGDPFSFYCLGRDGALREAGDS